MECVINNAVSHCMRYSVRKQPSAILRKRTFLFYLVSCYDVKIRMFASALLGNLLCPPDPGCPTAAGRFVRGLF